MISGAMLDSKGEVKGVVHLYNKMESEEVLESDRVELEALLPALGEIIRTADESLEVFNITSSLYLHLDSITKSIRSKLDILAEKQMPILATSVH